MRKKVLSVFLIAVCILSFTGCSVAGKYVNTKDSSSYIELYSGSSEKKGTGYGRYIYLKGRKLDQVWITYANGTAKLRFGNINYDVQSEQISVNKSAKSITYSGYTYKKK